MAGSKTQPTGKGILFGLYQRCMDWIAGPYGVWVLFFIALVESSFFPIPPDVFLIAMCLAAPRQAFKYAAICSVGSVLGGVLGYGFGLWFMDSIGQQIIGWYGLEHKYEVVQNYYRTYDFWAIIIAGFTPLPYKLFTITAGAFKINFAAFVVASVVSRSARFFLIALLIHKFGAPVKLFIERYFNILTIVFMVLLIGGFVLIKWLM
jgi:membrane protein YqaA with SNARE-associated domain